LIKAFNQNIICSFLLPDTSVRDKSPKKGPKKGTRKRSTASRDPLRSSGQAVFWEEDRLSFGTTVVNNSGTLIGSISAKVFLYQPKNFKRIFSFFVKLKDEIFSFLPSAYPFLFF